VTGIQFLTDEKGRKEKGKALEKIKIKADLVKRWRVRE
jgi:hypothetical protein